MSCYPNLRKCALSELPQFKKQELYNVLPFLQHIVAGFDSLSEPIASFEKQIYSLIYMAHLWEEANLALGKVEKQLTLLKQSDDSTAMYEARKPLLSTMVEVLSFNLAESQCDSAKIEVEKLQAELVI